MLRIVIFVELVEAPAGTMKIGQPVSQRPPRMASLTRLNKLFSAYVSRLGEKMAIHVGVQQQD